MFDKYRLKPDRIYIRGFSVEQTWSNPTLETQSGLDLCGLGIRRQVYEMESSTLGRGVGCWGSLGMEALFMEGERYLKRGNCNNTEENTNIVWIKINALVSLRENIGGQILEFIVIFFYILLLAGLVKANLQDNMLETCCQYWWEHKWWESFFAFGAKQTTSPLSMYIRPAELAELSMTAAILKKLSMSAFLQISGQKTLYL